MNAIGHASREDIVQYLAGELTLHAVQALEAHLRVCASCQEVLVGEVAVDGVLPRLAAHMDRRDQAASRWRRGLWSGAGALALAAAVMLVVGPQVAPTDPPAFVVEVAGGVQAQRGAAPVAAGADVIVGSRLHLTLTPEVAVDGLQIRAFDLRSRVEIPVQADQRPGGNARVSIEVTDGSPLASVGAHELLLALGRADLTPPDDLGAWQDDDADGWRLLRVPIRTLPTGEP